MRISSRFLLLLLFLLFVFPVYAFADINQGELPSKSTNKDALAFYSYIVKNNPRQSRELSFHLADVTVRVAEKTGLPLALLVAIQKVESSFRVTAVSHADARGAMQIHFPTWGESLGLSDSNKWKLFAPSVNVPVGAYILKKYLQMEDYNLVRALFRYLGMPDARLRQLSRDRQRQENVERLEYVRNIFREYREFREFHAAFIGRLGAER